MRYFELLAEDAASDRTQRNHARRILRDIAARLLEAEPRKAVWTTYRGRNRTPIELPLGYTTLADLGMPKYSDLAIGYMGAYGSMSGSIIDLNQARKIGEGVLVRRTGQTLAQQGPPDVREGIPGSTDPGEPQPPPEAALWPLDLATEM
jgi:hypothetical protein